MAVRAAQLRGPARHLERARRSVQGRVQRRAKYVASSNPATRLEWPNSTLLHGDVPAAVADLKRSQSANLVILGSGVLIGSLMAGDLIDEYLLMITPLVLGSGRRLFAGGTYASLELVESSTSSTGVLMAVYERARG